MHCSICTASVVWVPNCTACTVWDLGGYVSVNVLRPITNNTAPVPPHLYRHHRVTYNVELTTNGSRTAKKTGPLLMLHSNAPGQQYLQHSSTAVAAVTVTSITTTAKPVQISDWNRMPMLLTLMPTQNCHRSTAQHWSGTFRQRSGIASLVTVAASAKVAE